MTVLLCILGASLILIWAFRAKDSPEERREKAIARGRQDLEWEKRSEVAREHRVREAEEREAARHHDRVEREARRRIRKASRAVSRAVEDSVFEIQVQKEIERLLRDRDAN